MYAINTSFVLLTILFFSISCEHINLTGLDEETISGHKHREIQYIFEKTSRDYIRPVPLSEHTTPTIVLSFLDQETYLTLSEGKFEGILLILDKNKAYWKIVSIDPAIPPIYGSHEFDLMNSIVKDLSNWVEFGHYPLPPWSDLKSKVKKDTRVHYFGYGDNLTSEYEFKIYTPDSVPSKNSVEVE